MKVETREFETRAYIIMISKKLAIAHFKVSTDVASETKH